MGKLNIANHHPFRRDYTEKVRKDEEEARRKEESEDGRIMLANSESRIDLLRGKSVALDKTEKKKMRRDDDDLKDLAANSSTRGPVLPTTNGYINPFKGLEQSRSIFKATKKVTPTEIENDVSFAPLAKDLKHLYSEFTREQPTEEQHEKRKRDESRNYVQISSTSTTKQLAARPSAPSSSSSYRPPLPSKANQDKPSEVQSRSSSESTDGERALELTRRKKQAVAVPQQETELVTNKCDECLKGNRPCLRVKGRERCEACVKSKKKCTLVTPRQSLKKGKGRERPRRDNSGSDLEDSAAIRIGPPKPKKRKIVRSSPEAPALRRVGVSVANRGRRQPSPPVHIISSSSVVESDSEPILNVSAPLTAPPAPIPPANLLQPPSSAPSVDDLQLHIRILQTEVDASQRELHAMREAQILQIERREEAMAAQFARQRAIYEERIKELSRESEPLRRYIAELEAEVLRLKSAGV